MDFSVIFFKDVLKVTSIVLLIAALFFAGVITISKMITNNIQQVGHLNATAHITCYSDKQKIYEAFVKDLSWNNNRYSFTREDINTRVSVNANCIVEE